MAGPIPGYAPTDADIEAALQRLLHFVARHVDLPPAGRRLFAHTFTTTQAEIMLSNVEHGADVAEVIRYVRATLIAYDRWTPDMRPAKHGDDPAEATSEVAA